MPTESDFQAPSRAERRDQQVQRVLDAAKACFLRSGFQGTSMQQICAEAGMSPGALYRYFPSKESIIQAICEANRRQDAEKFAAMEKSSCVVEGFVACGLDHLTFTHENGNAPIFAEIATESLRNETIRAIGDGCMAEVQDRFRTYLHQAVERGEIDPIVELDALLPMILAIGQGLAISDLLGRGVSRDQLEIMLRASMEALLRPRRPA
ncbi:TetR family transcriptional regulator [Mesorhizobium sp. NBSH29]|nr:TetR family transcriptional regulator [Mesorhizobium sp. NBSH29]